MNRQKYTKQQISNAIEYWQNKLNESSYSRYQSFFCKDKGTYLFRKMNIYTPKHLQKAIEASCSLNIDICAYNPDSYMNQLRVNESHNLYLDEKERETQPVDKLIDAIKKYCQHNIRRWSKGTQDFDKIFNIQCYDMNDDNTIAGNVLLVDFPFDIDSISLKQHIDQLSRRALLLGYNYVQHVDEGKETIDDGIKHHYASVQFEASYFSSNVKHGDFLYHIAPKSIAHKILQKGLLPKNQNSHGFEYEPRVYCFIDRYDQIFNDYATVSNKKSKKFVLNSKLEQEIEDFYQHLQTKLTGQLFDTHEFCVFKIDTAKLSGDVKFFRDNAFDVYGDFIAVYTTSPIKPDAISIVSEFVSRQQDF